LADQIALAAQEFDLLLFAKAHFAQPVCYFRRRGQLFNSHRNARIDPAQRAQKRLGTLTLPVAQMRLRRFHARQSKTLETLLQGRFGKCQKCI
jgi:hypothetical protein